MAGNFILGHYGTKSTNRQIVDIGTLYVEILLERFAGFILFSFTLFNCVLNIEARIFLNTHTVYNKQV